MFKIAIICTFTFVVFCNGSDNKTPGEYDQIVLNITHPVTAFWNTHKAWPKENNSLEYNLSELSWDTLRNPNSWIISSLWPSKNDGNHPINCYQGDRPPSSIESRFIILLRNQWPNLISKKYEVEHWSEAWIKYGMCMMDLQEMTHHIHYFGKASLLLHYNNFGTIFKNQNLYSGGSFQLSELQNALLSQIQVDGNLQCIEDTNGKQYLLGGSVCYNKQVKRETCIWVSSSTCDSNKAVYLPNLE